MNRNFLIILDKTIFKLIFYFFVLIVKLKNKKEINYNIRIENPKHFLVIRPGGAGDGIMSIPLLKALRKNYPQSKITLVCVTKSKAGLQLTNLYDELYIIDDFKYLIINLKTIFNNTYDAVFDLEQFRRAPSIISYLTGSKIRIGFDTNNRRLLYTHFVTYANDKHYESINIINQLKVIGIEVPYEETSDITFPLPDKVLAGAKQRLEEKNIDPDYHNIVAIFPGVLKAHHKWKMEEFAALTDLIINENQTTKVLLMGTSEDISDTQEVLKYLISKDKVTDLTGKLNFAEALGILTFCRIVIACDGGAVYMGAAMGCATISLWGPGVMERFKPPGKNHIGIRKDYSCIPCVNYSRLGEFPKCPYNRRCLNDITAEEVFNKYLILENLLSKEHRSELPNRKK